jgi:hypothetical protein
MLIVGLCLTMGAAAQKTNFIFILSDQKMPFTVQLGEKTFHSNTNGYLLMPSLPANEYTLLVSFPKNQLANQTFKVELKDKDRGFWLKQDIDNSVILQDQVSLAVIKNAVGSEVSKLNYDNKLQKTVIDSLATNAKGERIKINNPNLGNGTSVTYKAPPKLGPPPTSVTKTYEKVGVNGINQAFAVLNGSKLDTIFLFIPALDETKDLPIPVKKRLKENAQNEEESAGPTFDLPMPSNAMMPKKAKNSYN